MTAGSLPAMTTREPSGENAIFTGWFGHRRAYEPQSSSRWKAPFLLSRNSCAASRLTGSRPESGGDEGPVDAALVGGAMSPTFGDSVEVARRASAVPAIAAATTTASATFQREPRAATSPPLADTLARSAAAPAASPRAPGSFASILLTIA